jgi:signal transduction histidine kinase
VIVNTLSLAIIVGFAILLLLAFWWQQSTYLKEKLSVKMLYIKLQERNREIEEALARVRNEVPPLLNSLTSFAEALLQSTDVNLSEGQRADLATLRDNCQRLLEIVNQLPAPSEIETQGNRDKQGRN